MQAPAPESSGPSLFTALQEQLGLKAGCDEGGGGYDCYRFGGDALGKLTTNGDK